MANGTVRVRLATSRDVASWVELAREVEPLFGPMPDIATHIERGIARGTAIVAVDADNQVAGAMLFSRDDRPHHIHWLAVRASARRQGAGSALVNAALHRWNDGAPIEVVTFGADHPAGAAARALYSRCGFQFQEITDDGPEGGSRERWIRR